MKRIESNELKYSDFLIGQKIVCTNLEDEIIDYWDQHLTIGKTYIVDDVDFHFPESVAVKTDHSGVMFVRCKFFKENLKEIRKRKLAKIAKKSER